MPNPKKKEYKKWNNFTPIRMAEIPVHKDWKLVQDCTVSFDGGNWWVSLSYENKANEKVNPKTNKSTAIDVNIAKFNYLDEYGKQQEFALYKENLEKQYQLIQYYSKVLAKKRVKNSNWQISKKYAKTKTKLSRAHRRAVNIQEAQLNDFIAYLFRTFKIITIEDIDVKGMKMNKKMCKNLHRAMFGKFKTKMQQKAEMYNSELILADKFYPSTQRCSSCGQVKKGEDKLRLDGDRHGNKHNEYVCYYCGDKMDRDENAVLNLDFYRFLVYNTKNGAWELAHI